MQRVSRPRRAGGESGRPWTCASLVLVGLALLTFRTDLPAAETGWIPIDYGELVDRRELSHSGESVGALLERLDGRSARDPQSPSDLLRRSLLDPLIERYAFVLQDALDARDGLPDPPMVEVGALWRAGERQPAWAELLRARRYLVESDGQGRLRVCLPAVEGTEGFGAEALARAAARSWPILRHVFAAEQLRLSRRSGKPAAEQALQIDVHIYRHEPARSLFLLGPERLRTTVTDTRPTGLRAPLDLRSIQEFLESGLQLEGARLEPDGRLVLLGSRTDAPPSLLGLPWSLADLAVAYRAVFDGGLAEPYMSLDRGFSPQTSIVNYGGRLRDTALGMVSLLCDIRFKTFSIGLGIEEDRDLRAVVRAGLPSFRTHLERFAAYPGAQGVMGQQTRLWFYPDSVDLTVSPQGDVVAFRRVRMTASSERIQVGPAGAGDDQDPPWTRATVEAVNRDYDTLARLFPELRELDQVVRLLSLFTWLRQARDDGLAVPELDALLALELPALPTPRTFPQLLAINALPPPAGEGPVTVFDRVPAGEALERMNPLSGRPLPARRRFARALSVLDPDNPRNAALLAELRTVDPDRLDETALDILAYRAERLHMHQTVLSTLDATRREQLVTRRAKGEEIRVFSVGIGGLDLGMRQVLDRARGTSRGLTSGAGSPGLAVRAGTPAVQGSGPRDTGRNRVGAVPREAWRKDPDSLPAIALPDHGLNGSTGDGERFREFGNHRIELGTDAIGEAAKEPAAERSWVWTLLGADTPDVSSRRAWLDAQGKAGLIERVDGGRLLRYRLAPDGTGWKARLEPAPRRPPGIDVAVPDDALAPGLATLEAVGAAAGSAEGAEVETSRVRLRLSAGTADGARRLEADFPRALLRRLVGGREIDPDPNLPLRGLDPLPEPLGPVGTLMVLQHPAQAAPPWAPDHVDPPGEEDPARIARALGRWWSAAGGTGPARGAVTGTDGTRSVQRWASAPLPKADALLVLPSNGFPGRSAAQREEIARVWPRDRVAESVPERTKTDLVVLVSAEPPGLFAQRLRDLARLPAMRGKLLAAWSLAGSVRPDLPASLLAEGNLAGLGVADGSLTSRRAAPAEIASLAEGLAGAGRERVERLPGPFLWYF